MPFSVLHAGQCYPGGPDLVRRKAKEMFRANAGVADEGLLAKG
jgi:hypothetical protein